MQMQPNTIEYIPMLSLPTLSSVTRNLSIPALSAVPAEKLDLECTKL